MPEDAFPQKNADYDNQLWRVIDGSFPGPVYSGLSWGPYGTGPAPNSGTVGSGGNECAYQVSLSIQQDGSCSFSGYYQNRGDVWWGTAPPQGFVVAFFVFDTNGRAYAFSFTGDVPSAPQNGSLVTWNLNPKCPLVAENWYAIAARNWGRAYWWNTYDESIWGVLESWLSDAASDLGTLANSVIQAYEGGPDFDGGDDETAQIVKKPLPALPALPAEAPKGTAATAHNADAAVAGKGIKA